METTTDIQNSVSIGSLTELVSTKKNWEIEINKDFYGKDRTQIGIHKGNEIWHWFRLCTFSSGNSHLFFDQSYNRNTGAIKKGSSYGFDQVYSIKKALEKMQAKTTA